MISYFKLRSIRKEIAAALKQTTLIYKMQRDLVSGDDAAALYGTITSARAEAEKASDKETLTAILDRILKATGDGTPWHPLYKHGKAENFEIIVVAIAVAMAFRCYFLQPFKIPTGSMQPTLYGIHSVTHNSPTIFDKMPLKILKWAFTGDWYKEIRVKSSGTVMPNENSPKPGYYALRVAGEIYNIPSDALFTDNGQITRKNLNIRPDGTVKAGDVLWSGTIKSGDHIFVNRVKWNFTRPRRGDVMVFSTTGIKALPQGTHYIKRMSGMPGETLSIEPPNLIINGEAIFEPKQIARQAMKEKLNPKEPNYAGYQLVDPRVKDIDPDTRNRIYGASSQLMSPKDSVTLKNDEYFALGDNTGNSYDSRYWGVVPERRLLGAAAFIYWPFSRFRLID